MMKRGSPAWPGIDMRPKAIFLTVTLLSFFSGVNSTSEKTGATFPLSNKHFELYQLGDTFKLLTQYSYGTVGTCPELFKLEIPESTKSVNGTLTIDYSRVKIASGLDKTVNDDNVFDGTTCEAKGDSNALTLEEGAIVDAQYYKKALGTDPSSTIVFNSLKDRFSSQNYWISKGKVAPFACKKKGSDFSELWFSEGFAFFFFHEPTTVPVSFIEKLRKDGQMTVSTLQLPGHIRYMITTASQTTCIYRVIKDIILPSASPPLTPSASLSKKPSASPSVSASINTAQSPEKTASARPSPTIPATQTPIPSKSSFATNTPYTSTAPSPSQTLLVIASTQDSSSRSSPRPSAIWTASSTSVGKETVSVAASVTSSAGPLSQTPTNSPRETETEQPLTSTTSPSASVALIQRSPPPSGEHSPAPSSAVPVKTPTLSPSASHKIAEVSSSAAPTSSPSMTPDQSPIATRKTPLRSETQTVTMIPTPSQSKAAPSVSASASPWTTPLLMVQSPPGAIVASQSSTSSPFPAPKSPVAFTSLPWPSNSLEDLYSTSEPSSSLDIEPTITPEDEGPDNDQIVSGISACFPSSAKVELSNGSRVSMDKLKLGDKVLIGAGKYSEIFMFSHSDPDVYANFVRVETDGRAKGPLLLTEGHYVYANGRRTAAGKLHVGDTVTRIQGRSAVKTEIIQVTRETRAGLYNPHTLHGDIVVDGVLVSCYTEALQPLVAHAILTPFRALHRIGYHPLGDKLREGGQGIEDASVQAIKTAKEYGNRALKTVCEALQEFCA